MSSTPRVSGFSLIALLAASLLQLAGASVGWGADEPLPPIVVLQPPTVTPSSGKQVLVREVIRQAFLIAAREDFGARTRDPALREPVPGEKTDARVFQIDLDLDPIRPYRIRLNGVRNAADVTKWSQVIPPFTEVPVLTVLAKVDAWTRGPFATALEQAKLTKRTPPAAGKGKAGSSPKPAAAADLAPLEFCSEIASLRTLHAALAADPGSVPLLAAIAREYALLGSVTEVHWGGEHKIFKARALVYAERAVGAGPKDLDAAWTRALVRALVGLPAPADEEIRRALQLAADQPAGEPRVAAPPWSEALTAFVRWNETELGELAAQDEKPLAAYLQMLATELAASRDPRMAAVNRLIETQPECFRAIAALSYEGTLGIRRSVGAAQIRQFAVSFPRLLRQVPGLPGPFAKELESRGEATDQETSLAGHGALLKTLRGLDADTDPHEPSVAVLATLAEDLGYVHANQLVTTEFDWLAVDARQTIQQMQEMLETHPYRELLGCSQRDDDEAQAIFDRVAERLFALPLSAAAQQQCRLSHLKYEQRQRMSGPIRDPRDTTLPDLLEVMDDNISDAEKRRALPALQKLSPDCPAVLAASITYDWPGTAAKAAPWVESSSNPKVLRALAKRYESLEDESAANRALAERCLVRLDELETSFDSANSLAAYYSRHDNDERWKEVTIESLSRPSYGLEVPHACARLADWMMDRGEWTEAEPYARRAGQSYSSMGLQSAARCMELQQRWDEAERLYRAMAERYDSDWPDWYFFCRRTGHGDLEGATAFCQQQQRNQTASERSVQQVAFFHYLEGNHEDALRIHESYRIDRNEGAYATACTLLLLDEMKRVDDRDKVANAILTGDESGCFGLLADLVRRPRGPGAKPLSDAELELCYLYAATEPRATNAAYLIGRLLLNRGERDRAVVWLQRAATSPRTNLWMCTLAGAELVRLGVEIEPRRKTAWGDGFGELAARRRAMDAVWNPKQMDEADRIIAEGLKAAPEAPSLRLAAAFAARDRGDLAAAEKWLGEALEVLPGHPWVLSSRGKVREGLGREREAIEDYEAALATAPYIRSANGNLAWIRAASNNAEFRDGQAALRHARAAEAIGHDRQGIGQVALAAAHAEAGEFDEAVKLIRDSIQKKEYPEPERLNAWLESYLAKKPYRRAVRVP